MDNFRPAGMSDDEDWSDEDAYLPDRNQCNKEATTDDSPQKDPWEKLAQGGDLDQSKRINRVEDFMNFIILGDVDQVKQCLDSGMSCDETFQSSFLSAGKRPIFLASEHGQHQIVELLLTLEASLQPTEDRFTPLMAVCSSHLTRLDKNLAECAHLLLKSGKVDPNECSSQQITALMFACKRGHSEVAEVLVNHPNTKLDLVDSQNWSALMYAVDGGFGNIARNLLEKGANPNIASKEGTFPIDLAASKNNPTLYKVISYFSKSKGIDMSEPSGAFLKYSELDNVLLAVEGKDFIDNFKRHKADFNDFLVMNEADLIEIGVNQVGVRKKMLETIAEIHKREWEKTSIPQIIPRDKQKGLFLSAPDGALIIASISKHLKYITSNVTFLKRHLNEKPDMLLLGGDVANVVDIQKFTQDSLENLSMCEKQMREMKKQLSRLARDPKYAKVNTLPEASPFSWKSSIATPLAIFSAIAVGAGYLFSR